MSRLVRELVERAERLMRESAMNMLQMFGEPVDSVYAMGYLVSLFFEKKPRLVNSRDCGPHSEEGDRAYCILHHPHADQRLWEYRLCLNHSVWFQENRWHDDSGFDEIKARLREQKAKEIRALQDQMRLAMTPDELQELELAQRKLLTDELRAENADLVREIQVHEAIQAAEPWIQFEPGGRDTEPDFIADPPTGDA